MNRQFLTHYDEISPFITRDESIIRELMHPERHGSRQQSLAEARLPVRSKTLLHRHHRAEELYYITAGRGLMTLGEEKFEVKPGDTICISPGEAHCLENIGEEELVLLCCCAPAYSHDDTEILETAIA
jgi:mannose-6-phosphate isomerase-like protein (cupin superfamily)